jgi:phosphoserine aminotransferase
VAKNLIGLKPARKAMYFTSGLWSTQCIKEARKFIPESNLIEVSNLSASNFTQMTNPKNWKIDSEASYFHICINETVHGFEITEENFPWELIPKGVAIVGDMSSNIGTVKINWDRFDVVYAGVQKNMGPTGDTVIIVNKKLLGKADADVPIMCDW